MATGASPNPLGEQLFQARLKANDFVQEHLKTIVTISSGTLVLTVSFVKDVVGGSTAHARLPWLLAVSWAALGLAVFFGTFGLATLVNNLDDADMRLQGWTPRAFSAGKRDIVLRWVQRSIWCFAGGIGALALFGAINYDLFLHRVSASQQTVVKMAPPPPGPRFAMFSTPEHTVARNVVRSHTFLVDQATGQVWQMICAKGQMVTFQKMSIEGLPVPLPSLPDQAKDGKY